MIVKDESASLRATLDSVAPLISRFCILDTGSTDNTKEIINQWAKESGIDGHLYSEPFVDYATTRNRCLDLAELQHTTFTLFLSGDEVVEIGDLDARLGGLTKMVREIDGAYDVEVRWGAVTLKVPRLARVCSGWRYVGKTHEALVHPTAPAPTKMWGITIAHSEGDPARKTEQRKRDLAILQQAVADDPTDARSWYYLGQTLQEMDNPEGAFNAFSKRVELAGWDEEVFEAKLRMAECAALTDLADHADDYFIRAWKKRPTRAEPLYALAQRAYEDADFARMFLYACAGVTIRYPEGDRLFVRHEIYAWRMADLMAIAAWNMGRYQQGHLAALMAVGGCSPDHPDHPRLQKNLGHYTQQRAITNAREQLERTEP